MSKEIPKYCRECGSSLQESRERADKINIDHYCFGGVVRSRLGCAFDKHTGKENFANIFTCPRWNRHWLWGSNSHDKILCYQDDLYYE